MIRQSESGHESGNGGPIADVKDTNPKDAVGCSKPPLSVIPCPVLFEVGLALLEGSCKYGRHNYREAGVRGSIYYDAAMRHLMAWWEGQDLDPDSGLSHVTKAIAGLVVLRDAMMNNKWGDDRPPRPKDWMPKMLAAAKVILDRYPNPKQPYVHALVESTE